MEFLFHSVFNEGEHTRFFNIYRIDENRFLAECHHFNRERNCDGDFELVKAEGEWKTSDPQLLDVAHHIGEEIERMEPSPDGVPE